MLVLPNDIENETPADAVEVEQNYNVIEQYINSAVITRDGTVAMQAPLQLFGDPLSADDAVRKSYVDAILPIGIILPYGGAVAPAGSWASCNGATVQTSVYPKLFDVLGYRFGGSGGSFMLPNLAGKFPVGYSSSATNFNTVGKAGGTWDVPVPQHAHAMPHSHTIAHTHTINHDHGTVNTSSASVSSSNLWVNNTSGGGDIPGQQGSPNALSAGSSHYHSVNLPSYSGSSGGASTGSSGGSSAANTSNAGTASADHVSPYLTLLFVIRVG